MNPQRVLFSIASTIALQVSIVGIAPAPSFARFSGQEQASIQVYQRASSSVVTIKSGPKTGSGSIVSSDGLILTSEHVVRGRSNKGVNITTATGRRYTGTVIASNRRYDLALIQLRTSDRFPSLFLANSKTIRVGQQVFALGSPYGLSGTFTTGILSRIAENGDLQTDAALNPGNSGGPLLNSRGELIGVNKAILSPDRAGNVGIGFATNVGIVQRFLEQHRHRAGQPVPVLDDGAPLGIVVNSQFVVQEVAPRSQGARAGLRRGDRLIAIDGQRLNRTSNVNALLNQTSEKRIITISRNRRLTKLLLNR